MSADSIANRTRQPALTRCSPESTAQVKDPLSSGHDTDQGIALAAG